MKKVAFFPWAGQSSVLGFGLNLAALLLAGSLARYLGRIALFSSKNADRIMQAARVAGGEVFSSDQVKRFLELTPKVHI